ncbi:MAG: hypothetical protein PHE49_08820 [bacterium]|nr:hypothetical protein [bacterium]
MKNILKGSGILIILGVFVLGCQGPKIKKALDGMVPQIQDIMGRITNAKSVFGVIDAASEQMTDKISRREIDSLDIELNKIRGFVPEIVAFESKLIDIKDSIAVLEVLDKKAKDPNLTTIRACNQAISTALLEIGEFKKVAVTLDTLSAKLNAMKKGAENPKAKGKTKGKK